MEWVTWPFILYFSLQLNSNTHKRLSALRVNHLAIVYAPRHVGMYSDPYKLRHLSWSSDNSATFFSPNFSLLRLLQARLGVFHFLRSLGATTSKFMAQGIGSLLELNAFFARTHNKEVGLSHLYFISRTSKMISIKFSNRSLCKICWPNVRNFS